MRIVNEDILEVFRQAPECEWCGKENRTGLDPHHVLTRGAGGPDVAENLVALCRRCHQDAHNGRVKPSELLAVAAKRCRMTVAEVEKKLWRLRRRSLRKRREGL